MITPPLDAFSGQPLRPLGRPVRERPERSGIFSFQRAPAVGLFRFAPRKRDKGLSPPTAGVLKGVFSLDRRAKGVRRGPSLVP